MSARVGSHYKGVGFALANRESGGYGEYVPDYLYPNSTAGGPGSDQTVLTNPFRIPMPDLGPTGGGNVFPSSSGYNSTMAFLQKYSTPLMIGGAILLVMLARRR